MWGGASPSSRGCVALAPGVWVLLQLGLALERRHAVPSAVSRGKRGKVPAAVGQSTARLLWERFGQINPPDGAKMSAGWTCAAPGGAG